jgi:hypothetical protein
MTRCGQPANLNLRMEGRGHDAGEDGRALDVSLGRFTVKVLPLPRILASQQAANREKDRLTIPVLRDAVAATVNSAGQKRRKEPAG